MGFNQATKICIDNSEWMRNNDYSPSRFQAQTDAISLTCGAKTQCKDGCFLTSGKEEHLYLLLKNWRTCLEMGGEMNLATGIQIAQLALKHRQKKNQQQRIIVFAGSPIKYEKKALEMIGKKLKKNSVALDIVNFGEDDNGKPKKLKALLASVNNDSSHIVHVPLGQNALSDVLMSTPVFSGDRGGSGFAAAAAAVGASDFEIGIDPNIDPELALALRFCMEEERARQEAAAKRGTEEARKQEKREEAQAPSDSQNATPTEKVADPMIGPTMKLIYFTM
ncbi:hypothetical protein PVK06_004560 [Gossypium arboreum]|uniref:VWFA domain-containing protein n=1 Tax=Gossypium arboreum TaxID=29729 RepID=A0ABR0QTP0_GOSAR|nr:hypothetical protein PVK06_004560 [Gossypium arboreum]